MSRSISLRRSPKPGALTASTLTMPRSLFTTSVARASPSTSSATMSRSFLPGGDDLLERRDHVRDGADLLVGDEDVGLVEHRLHAVGVGHEVGADVAAVELHALDVLGLEGHGAALLDRDDAVLAGLVEDVGDEVADLLVGGADGRHLGDLVVAGDRDRRLR